MTEAEVLKAALTVIVGFSDWEGTVHQSKWREWGIDEPTEIALVLHLRNTAQEIGTAVPA